MKTTKNDSLFDFSPPKELTNKTVTALLCSVLQTFLCSRTNMLPFLRKHSIIETNSDILPDLSKAYL